MGKIFERVRQYPWVVAASVVGILGLALQGSVEGVLSQWLVAIMGALRAVREPKPRHTTPVTPRARILR
ncbi:MAG: hypothetical protein HOJ98_01625 [Microbacteriaceae bacterium]|nr:hypothetical protein [Microbacteriaceae bacterium]